MQTLVMRFRRTRRRSSLLRFGYVACLVLLGVAGLYCRQPKDLDLPETAKLDAIYFENENHGFVRTCCRQNGFVFETDDGGRTWMQSERPVRGLRRGRVFIDGLKGWSVVEDKWPHSSLYETNDGGKTWTVVVRAERQGNFYFDSIQAVSSSTVWALGLDTYHTSDGGKNWDRVQTGGYSSIDFFDQSNGWILGDKVWKTVNGGKTWRAFDVPTSLFPVSSKFLLTDVFFSDLAHGWIVGGENEQNLPNGKKHGIVLGSTDGGEHWTALANLEGQYLSSVFFLNTRIGWIAGLDGVFLKTADGGKTWVDLKTGQRIPPS